MNVLPRLRVGGDLLGQGDKLGDDLGGGQVLVGVPAHQLGEALGEARLLDDVVPGDLAHLLLDQAAQRLDGQVRVALRAHPLDERLVQVGQVRAADAGGGVDVGDAAGLDGARR